jgi:4-hydroxy-L-threonine phosphate dehydrogenase PdxA
MSFFGGELRVVLLSTHLSLRHALDLVKKQPLIALIRFSSAELAATSEKACFSCSRGFEPARLRGRNVWQRGAR